MFMLLASAVGYAANYSVTVTTQRQIEYRDKATNSLVDSESEAGNVMVFQVVADTPREAEDRALTQCQGACDSGIAVLAAENVTKKGKLCNKYIKTVPWSAEAKLK